MPIYEYECTKCGRIEEAIQKFSDRPLTKCTHCAGRLQKLVSHSSFHLKGTGWYATDYAGKSGNATSDSRNSETPSAEKAEKTPSTDTQKASKKAPD